MMSRREASHAGSWYKSDKTVLSFQLENWLAKAEHQYSARAIISPHAGYSYCGSCAAHCYKQINPSKVKRVFVLGPSHHYGLPGCALTKAAIYETPFYGLTVDQEVNRELLETGKFELMDKRTDEDEHSIEMQMPYVAKIMESQKGLFTIVPVLVGSTNKQKEEFYGQLFSKYLVDPENLFVISSDFCHWGKRFRYTYYDKSHGKIYESIEALDRMGMRLIEDLNTDGFYEYLNKYSNTICGRHPIGIFLNAVANARKIQPSADFKFKFLAYSQSGSCLDMNDSSVSYAAGVLNF